MSAMVWKPWKWSKYLKGLEYKSKDFWVPISCFSLPHKESQSTICQSDGLPQAPD